ncbi:MAG: lipid-A-disaccharide synthase [Synechococcales bacterium]|nr:lipid-A-disaccharide synthase [Synechococcales bacterium]
MQKSTRSDRPAAMSATIPANIPANQPANQPADILILSNGPGEITTWVRPVVKALRKVYGSDHQQIRISLVLAPCPNASGKEVAIATQYPEIDRIQGAAHFFPFLLWGQTAENWDWRDRGVVLFLGGDQLYPILIGKRLGYRIVIYGEWDTRWHRWGDRYAVMKADLIHKAPPQYAHKFTIVGDLMADTPHPHPPTPLSTQIALLPGSKPAKLTQGVPLCLAIAHTIHQTRPDIEFVIPVAPTLDLATLAQFADPATNPLLPEMGNVSAALVREGDTPYLMTPDGFKVRLWTDSPAYDLLSQCQLALTTIGANTAELGSLGVPMIVLLPTQQLDAMRAWDGIPGLLANLPGVGTLFAKAINGWFLRKKRLLAWPNIWAGEEIVPELVGHLQPQPIAQQVLEYLQQPERLAAMRDRLRAVRGEPGAATKLAQIVMDNR